LEPFKHEEVPKITFDNDSDEAKDHTVNIVNKIKKFSKMKTTIKSNFILKLWMSISSHCQLIKNHQDNKVSG